MQKDSKGIAGAQMDHQKSKCRLVGFCMQDQGISLAVLQGPTYSTKEDVAIMQGVTCTVQVGQARRTEELPSQFSLDMEPQKYNSEYFFIYFYSLNLDR